MVRNIRGLNFFFRNYCSVKLSVTTYTNNKTVEINRSLLITHGLLGSKQNWNSIAKNLNYRFKEVVTIDLRNHGDSPHNDDISIEAMSCDLGDLISSNNYHHPVLIGHSLGGKVAMHLALSQPRLLSSLVVVDIAPVATPQINEYRSYLDSMISANIDQNLSLPANRKIISEHLSSCVQDIDIRNFLLTNLGKEEKTNLIKWRVNLSALRRSLEKLILFPVPPGGVYQGQTLFISGAKSKHIRGDHWPLIEQLFPHASLSAIEGAGHWVHADKPREFIDALVRFMLR